MVTSTEDVDALLPLFGKCFGKLAEINLKFFSPRRLPTIEQYKALYDFISYQVHLTRLQLVNPPLHPDTQLHSISKPGPGLENTIGRLKFLRLKELTLKMHGFPEDSADWFLPRFILENANCLQTLECEGIDVNIVQNALKSSASTLTSVTVIGLTPSPSPSKKLRPEFSCSSLKNCVKLRNLHLREFLKVHDIHELPKNLTTIEIWNKAGSGVDVDLRSIADRLRSLESLTVRNRDVPTENDLKSLGNNRKLKYLCLSKFSEDMAKYSTIVYQGISVTTEILLRSGTVVMKSDNAGIKYKEKVEKIPALEPEERVVIRFDREIFGRRPLSQMNLHMLDSKIFASLRMKKK